MLKSDARKIYRDKRNSISAAEKSRLDDLLLIQFQSADLPFLHTVLSYRAIEENNEPNAELFTAYLEFRNPSLEIAYPRMNHAEQNFDAVMVNADTAFRSGPFNVPEPIGDHIVSPESFDLVIVPLLVCDLSGIRVGYGKGFYDKYLTHCRPDCIKCGLIYFDPVDSISDAAEFDVPLDLCITPRNIYVF